MSPPHQTSPPLGSDNMHDRNLPFSPRGLGGLEVFLCFAARANPQHIDPCLLGLTVLRNNARY
jgi:hypothetical protein